MSLPSILAVTMGDPAGAGPEVCLKATRLHQGAGGLALFGDAEVFSQLACTAELPLLEAADSLGDAVAIARDAGAAVYHIESLGGRWEPRRVSALTGEASYRYITAAIDAALAGQVDGVVTGPIHNEALSLSGVPYPGHTEIFGALTKSSRACMMLTSDALTCSFVTTHVGLCEVPGMISTQRVLDVIELTDEAVRNIHGRASRLVVCGLNPHAGEGENGPMRLSACTTTKGTSP